MRLDDLRGMASIDARLLDACLRGDEALPALPVFIAEPPREALLLAAASGLTILMFGDGSSGVTREDVGWDHVRLAAADTTPAPPGPEAVDRYHLAVVVEDRVYHALLEGPDGRAALRDFVIFAQARRGRGIPPCPV